MTGRRGLRVITLLLATMAIFCILSGSALAARPKSIDESSQFTIEKFQKIANTDSSFTTGELTAEVGQTVDYEIVVTNTSDETLNFGKLEDEDCTNISPEGETELEAGESENSPANTPSPNPANGKTSPKSKVAKNSRNPTK